MHLLGFCVVILLLITLLVQQVAVGLLGHVVEIRLLLVTLGRIQVPQRVVRF